jgi:hypothetical protein
MLFDFMSGGLSYDPAIVVANTAARLPWVLLFSGLAFLGGFVQMIAGLWMGFKHKTHGVPLLCAAWFFAHDTTYFLNYNHWFHEQDFWVAQGAWFQMGFYMITELIVMFQIMKYSRAEVFPGMGFLQALLSLVGVVVLNFALFWWFMSMLNDPLYLLKMASTVLMGPVWLIPMMQARGSRKGFNAVSIGGVLLLSAAFWPWLFLIEPYFLQPMIVIVALVNVAMGAACYRYWLSLPEYGPT